MMHDAAVSIDVGSYQMMKHRQRVCGDTFIYRRIKEDNRWIAVLSDGLGSGIKANVLSTLTATMALNYTSGFRNLRKSAETIMRTLPICSERKISYATFTIVDIDAAGDVRIINYDNPAPIIMRNGIRLDIPYSVEEGTVRTRRYLLSLGSFRMTFGDRIILCSDGVSQAGMGSGEYPFGWGTDMASFFAGNILKSNADCSARNLSRSIVQRAIDIDRRAAHDDITCAVIHCRRSRELLVVTGPPVEKENDRLLVQFIERFNGRKIVCGGTTAKIVARELRRTLSFRMEDMSSPLPPVSQMEGFELVTEGIITLHAVEQLLSDGKEIESMAPSAARDIVEQMLESDRVHFLTGTRINEAWQDPALPSEIGLRRTIVARIMQLLEHVYHKETKVTFI